MLLQSCIKEVNTDFDYKNKICVSARISPDRKSNYFYLLNNLSLTDTIPYPYWLDNFTIKDGSVMITDDLGNSNLLSLVGTPYINDSTDFQFKEGHYYSMLVTTPDGRKATSTMYLPIATGVNSIVFDTSSLASISSVQGVSRIKRDISLSLNFTGSEYYNQSNSRVYCSLYYKTLAGFDTSFTIIQSFDFDKQPTQYFNETTLSVNDNISYYTDSIVAVFRMDIDSIDFELQTEDATYSNYLKSIQKQQSAADDPFAEPVLLYSNIKEGLGVFSGYSVKNRKVKFK